jgi:hypothetical protein
LTLEVPPWRRIAVSCACCSPASSGWCWCCSPPFRPPRARSLPAPSPPRCTTARRPCTGCAPTRGATTDPDRFAAMGNSSGRWLAAMLAVSGGVARLEGGLGPRDWSSRVHAVIDLYGPTNFLQLDEHMLPGGCDIINRISGGTDCHNDPLSPESRLVGCPIQSCPRRWRTPAPPPTPAATTALPDPARHRRPPGPASPERSAVPGAAQGLRRGAPHLAGGPGPRDGPTLHAPQHPGLSRLWAGANLHRTAGHLGRAGAIPDPGAGRPGPPSRRRRRDPCQKGDIAMNDRQGCVVILDR